MAGIIASALLETQARRCAAVAEVADLVNSSTCSIHLLTLNHKLSTRVYGSPVPDLLFTNEMSALLRLPSVVTSLRKLPDPTV